MPFVGMLPKQVPAYDLVEMASSWSALMAWTATHLCKRLVHKFSKRVWWVVCALATMTPAARLQAADILVTTSADSGAGSLRAAIEAATSGDRIVFASSLTGGNTITLQSQLLIIDKNLTIDGSANPNLVINGNSQHRAFFVGSNTTPVEVNISSLTIANVTAQGGHGAGVTGFHTGTGGGGGGLGAGAAVFVDSGATVTVSAIKVENSAAIGGNGGNRDTGASLGGGGGGGGLGGHGGHGGGGEVNINSYVAGSGGGGGGLGGAGGNGTTGAVASGGGGGGGLSGAGGSANGGNATGLASGGSGGGGGNNAGGSGTSTAGNGGNGDNASGGGGGGGGGVGGQDGNNYNAPTNPGGGGSGGYGGGGGGAGDNPGATPGNGGDFGGGGGATTNGSGNGGHGGFGGGGGGSKISFFPGAYNGGSGGFGGGGGASHSNGTPGSGGDYGGDGASSGGGGGGALGGAIFVREGGSLIIQDSSFTGGRVTGGTGSGSAGNGQAVGSSIFLHNVDLNVDVTGSNTAIIADDIADNSGVMGGSASSLNKTGTGTLILQGNNAYAGDTVVQGGMLHLQGSLAGNANVNGGHLKNNGVIAGNATVNAGSTLSGSGLIQGNVEAFGTVAPGNSIGTLYVGTNFNTHNSTVLEIEIAPGGTTPGVHNDVINVTGQAVLNGGTVSVVAAPGNYQNGSTYTFLTATGGVSGTFDGIIDNLAFFDAMLVYDPSSVGFTLVGNQRTFADVGQTPNQRSVGRYLDELQPIASGPLAELLDAYVLATEAEVLAALTQYQGQIYATLPVSHLQQTSQNLALLRNELALALECDERGENGWVRGYGMGGSVSGNYNATGYDAGIGGTELAYQRCVGDRTSIGAFGNFGWSTIGLRDLQERADVDSYQAGLTFQHVCEVGYVLAIVGAGVQDNDVRRTIDTVGVSGVAKSSFASWQQFNYLEVGSRIWLGDTEFCPYIAGQYIFLQHESLHERGVDPVNLAVDRLNVDSVRTFVGTSWALPGQLPGGGFKLIFRAAWMHEYADSVQTIHAGFVGVSGPSFKIDGVNPGRDFGLFGVGLHLNVGQFGSVFGGYDLQANGRQDYHTGSAGWQLIW